MGKNDRIVYRRDDGWVNQRLGAERVGSIHSTQKAAEISAREMLTSAGGGELITKGRNGQIRSKDTIGGGNDSCPPRDREH